MSSDNYSYKVVSNFYFVPILQQISGKIQGVPFEYNLFGNVVWSNGMAALEILEKSKRVFNFPIEKEGCLGNDFIGKMNNYYVLISDFSKITTKTIYLSSIIFIDENTKKWKEVALPRIYYGNLDGYHNYKIFENSLYHFVNTKENAQFFKISETDLTEPDSLLEKYPNDLNYEYNYYDKK